MNETKQISLSFGKLAVAKLSDVAQLYKLRLGSLVVFSSVIGYMLLVESISWLPIFVLSIGGFLVTGASNAFNQIFERDVDALMTRTRNRPLPTQRMSIVEASLWAGIAALLGLILLTVYFNSVVGLLSAISLITYAFIYTPLKRVHPIAVFVGAIPGALPPMIGAVAASGMITSAAVYLFLIQFVWQFPHFWAIAWVQYDDYKKAGIMLLPSNSGKSLGSAINIFVYTLTLIPLSILIYSLDLVSVYGLIALIVCAIIFLKPCYALLKEQTDSNARKVMFGSFLYLPLALIVWFIDKLIF